MRTLAIIAVSLSLAIPVMGEAGMRRIRDNYGNTNKHYQSTPTQNYGDLQGDGYYTGAHYGLVDRQVKRVKRKTYPKVELNFADSREPTGSNVFLFDPAQGGWAAYDASGILVRTGAASGGASWCADVGRSCRTKVGAFKVYRKGGAGCKSGKFPIRRNGKNGGAPMPHCMFFHGGFAVHGSYDVPNYNASHGCVRVHPAAAEWLHNDFLDIGSKVIVKPYKT